MKNRILLAILLIFTLSALIFAFGGCQRPPIPQEGDQQTTEDDGKDEEDQENEDDKDGETLTGPVAVYYIFTGETRREQKQILEWGDCAPFLPVSDTEDYTFLCWATSDGTEWDFSTPVEETLYLYTQWEYKPYLEVIFYDPSGNPIRQSVRKGEPAEEPTVSVEKGYYFEGWYTDSSCSQKYDLSAPVTQELELYAKILPVPVTISFEYDGKDLAPIHTYYGESISLPVVKEDGKCLYGYSVADSPEHLLVYRGGPLTVPFLSDIVLTPYFVPAWSFELINDGTEYRIDHYELMNTYFYPETETVTLPSTHEGKPVTEIAPDAFRNDNHIRKLIIPGSYRTVGDNSFSACFDLEEVILEEGVQTIGFCAFESCANLKTVSLPQSLTTIKNSAFYRSGLTDVSLPANLETIETGVFASCDAVIRTNRTAPAAGWAKNWSGNCIVLYDGYDYLNQNGMTFILTPEGEASLNSISDLSLTSLELPDAVTKNGKTYRVTKLSDNSLYELHDLRTLILPDSLEWLGNNSLPDSSYLEYTQKDGLSFLGSRTNPYLVLRSISYLQHDVTVPAQTRIVYPYAGSMGILSLQFEEGCDLKQIGNNAFSFNNAKPFELSLPSVKYMGSNAFSGKTARIFYAGEGELWAQDWDENACSFDLTKGKKFTDETGEWFLQDGKASLLLLTADTQDGFLLPSDLTADGQTYTVTSVLRFSLYEKVIPFLYIPDTVTYFDESASEEFLSYLLFQESFLSEGISLPISTRRCYFGIDGDSLLREDGTLFVSANGTARALCRYSREKYDGAYALPRTVQGVPVDGILSGFFPSVDYTVLVLFDNILYIEQAQTNYYVSAVYAQAGSAPEGWKEDWFMEWLNKSIPVFYGIDSPRETPATFTFITEGSAVSNVEGYFLINEQKTQLSGKYFWGWYEDAEFTGTPVSFPYFGNATTLYARFETERMQDGKSYDTAFELEEGVSREIAIGAGEEVFLRFAVLELNQKYTVKSTGDADTFGELYGYSSSLVSSADGGGAGENFSISFTKKLGTYYLVVKLTDKTASATVGVIYFAV